MKTKVIGIITLLIVVLASCGGAEAPTVEDQEKVNNPEKSMDVIEARIDSIRGLDLALTNSTINGAKSAAKKLYESANRFANDFPDDKMTPSVLELSAKSCDVMGRYEEAINILHKLINDFPETEETPKYMFTKALLLDDKLNKTPNAIAAFKDLSARFPDTQWATDADLYVSSYVGKSEEELQQVLDSVILANPNN